MNEIIYCADFETTTYPGIQRTDVWAWSTCNIDDLSQDYGNHIETFFNRAFKMKCKQTIYFRNLKFDGTFIITYLHEHGFKQAFSKVDGKITGFQKDSLMENKTYKYLISDAGVWYSIKIKYNKFTVLTILDSYKLIPYSIEATPKAFGFQEAKGKIDYEKMRFPGGELTDEEITYVKEDTMIDALSLRYMFEHGHNAMTIGSCCMREFKKILTGGGLILGGMSLGKMKYSDLFPDLYKIAIPKDKYGSENVGEYIRHSYRGAWTYCKPEVKGKIVHDGITLDVNSLYPSEMESESGNKYPIGKPYIYHGKPSKKVLDDNGTYVFIRLKTKFKIKEGYLPFIQIKNSFLYKGNEHLTRSDWKDIDGNYHDKIPNGDGTYTECKPELTMTETDYKLFIEHYDIYDTEYLDFMVFEAVYGVFDEYIHHYKDVKIHAQTKGERTIAKLLSNNLYGKMAASPNSSFKIVQFNADGAIIYENIKEDKKRPGYIPCGSAITSYARNFIIRAAQKVVDKLAYCDTDSLHLYNCKIDDVRELLPLDKVLYSHFKWESSWDTAIFARQKTYIEHVIIEDEEQCEPYYLIKCAGMGKDSKKLLALKLGGKTSKDLKETAPSSYKAFMDKEFNLLDFKSGLTVPGTLKAVRMNGGTVLKNSEYKMKGDMQIDVRKLLQRKGYTGLLYTE